MSKEKTGASKKKSDKIVDKTESNNKSTSTLVASLVNQYRNADIVVEHGHVGCEFVDTGNYALNYILSGSFDYGIPVGSQLTEIHGDNSTGKSLLLYNIISNFMKKYPNSVVILDDTENSYVDYLDSSLEIDESRLMRMKSDTVEDHVGVVFTGYESKNGNKTVKHEPLIKSLIDGGVEHILVAVDSIAALSTEHEQEIGLSKPDMGKAKMLRTMLRVIMPIVKRHNITYITTNHLIANIGEMFGPKKVTPGGTGPAYQASIRLSLSSSGRIKLKGSNLIVGIVSTAMTVKNRFTPPMRKCRLEIMMQGGLSKYSGLIDLFKLYNILEESSGGWYKIKDTDCKFQVKDLPNKWEEIRKIISSGKLQIREGIDNIEEEEETKEEFDKY